ncbi:hypothetical protein ES703_11602 [subsurface metagenome]
MFPADLYGDGVAVGLKGQPLGHSCPGSKGVSIGQGKGAFRQVGTVNAGRFQHLKMLYKISAVTIQVDIAQAQV